MDDLQIRACAPAESDKWAEFLDRNFGYQAPQSYAVDFAPLFSREALARSRLAWRGPEIVGSATLYPATVKALGRDLRLGIVGAVATGESFRGQGLSSRLLGELEKLAGEARLDALVLWSDQREFYEKVGFRAVGRQQIFGLADLPPPRTWVRGTAAYGWDWRQVRALYEAHAIRVLRTPTYWKALETVKSCTRVQWLDDNGKMLAYLGFDRGKDLHGIVHEWGGDPHALHGLLWIVLQNRPNLTWLTHPSLDDSIRPLLPVGPLSSSALAFAKPVAGARDPAAFAATFDDVWFWGLDSL